MLDALIPEVENRIGRRIDRRRYLLVGNAFSKFSVFLYFEDNGQPACIAKIAFDDNALGKVRNEYLALEHLSQAVFADIRVARPLGYFSIADKLCFLQEYIDSRLMIGELPLFRHSFAKDQFDIAVRGLIELYKSSTQSTGCFQHGDFWLGNMGLRANNLVLYDLEFASLAGKPLYDLLHFGIYYFRVIANIGKVKVLRRPGANGEFSNDNRVLALQAKDVQTVFGSVNKYSKVMYSAIFEYIAHCVLDDADALQLILAFVEFDRQIEDLPDNWKMRIESTYHTWRNEWNGI